MTRKQTTLISKTTKIGAKKRNGRRNERQLNRKNPYQDRRQFIRYSTPDLWVTERSGDYQYIVPALNISEGGIFLKNRLKSHNAICYLTIPLGANMLTVEAEPLYDRVAKGVVGTGYQFINLSVLSAQAIREYTR